MNNLPPPPILYFFSFLFFFLLFHQRHVEVPRLGVKSESQLPAYATATATQDPSHVQDPHHSSQQHQILNVLSEARDQTCILIAPSWVRQPLSHIGNSLCFFLFICFNIHMMHFFFLWLHLWHMDVPGPGTEPTLLQLPEPL